MSWKFCRSVFVAMLLLPLSIAQSAGPLHAATLTTEFNANNGESGNLFDVVVLGNALTVTAFDLNLSTGPYTIEIYTRSGTWVGHDTSSAGWTLVDSIANVTGNGLNVPTFVDVNDFTLPGHSTTGLYVTTTAPSSLAMNYTSGSGALGDIVAQNADLQILEGAGIIYPFGQDFIPRIWNGTIVYNQAATPLPAAFPLFATGLGALGLLGWRRKRKAQAAPNQNT